MFGHLDLAPAPVGLQTFARIRGHRPHHVILLPFDEIFLFFDLIWPHSKNGHLYGFPDNSLLYEFLFGRSHVASANHLLGIIDKLVIE
jgi:hypothetical protein